MEAKDLEEKVDYAMTLIGADVSVRGGIRDVVERMILAGFEKHETCDPVGYDD